MDFEVKLYEDKDGHIVLNLSKGTAYDFLYELDELCRLAEGYELAERIQSALRNVLHES